jgi:hypothetical protein
LVTGLCCFPRSSIDDARGIAPGGVLHLAEARRVDVQGLHVDDDFVVPELAEIVVEAPRGLREDAARLEDPMRAEPRALLFLR